MEEDYQVIVGNIGTVYDGNNHLIALRTFLAYKRSSMIGTGKASGESVILMHKEEIEQEYYPAETTVAASP